MSPAQNDYTHALIRAARDGDVGGVHAAFLMIGFLGGDGAFLGALARLTDELITDVPRPTEETGRYALYSVGYSSEADGVMRFDVPYELEWSIGLMTARLNGDDNEFRALVESAATHGQMATCATALAFYAGNPDHLTTSVIA